MFDLIGESAGALPIHLVSAGKLTVWLEAQPLNWRNWLAGRLENMKAGAALMLPGDDGAPSAVLAVVGDSDLL